MLIDDFSRPGLVSALGTKWRSVSDQVMGGLSESSVRYQASEGRSHMHISGDVRLDNNGGFIQAALDLEKAGKTLDASTYQGIRLVVRGNNKRYSVHLRSIDVSRPWQSYRAHFCAEPRWNTIELPFGVFVPHRIEKPMDIRNLKRIGLVAIGRAFFAELLVSRINLYR